MAQNGNLFEGSQLGLDLGDSSAAIPISPHAIRLQLNALIAQVQASQDKLPWDNVTERNHQLTFPQLAKILPPEEAVFLSRQFVFELERAKRRIAG